MPYTKCPVCRGSGTQPDGEQCWGCNGHGRVELTSDDEADVVRRGGRLVDRGTNTPGGPMTSHRSGREEMGTILRRRYRFTWLVFGAAFLMICCRWEGASGVLNVGPPITLMIIYFFVGRALASITAYWTERSGYDFGAALFRSTLKVGLIAIVVIALVHGALMFQSFNPDIQPDFRSFDMAVIGSIIFPFMACISAAATLTH